MDSSRVQLGSAGLCVPVGARHPYQGIAQHARAASLTPPSLVVRLRCAGSSVVPAALGNSNGAVVAPDAEADMSYELLVAQDDGYSSEAPTVLRIRPPSTAQVTRRTAMKPRHIGHWAAVVIRGHGVVDPTA